MSTSDPPAELEEIVQAFARAASAAGVPYAFVGGVAVGAWGQPRTTSDIDVIVDLYPELSDRFAESLKREGLELHAGDLAAGLRDGSHVTVFTGDPVLNVDIKLSTDRTEKEELAEAVAVPLGETEVRIIRPEHTVAYKVLFGSEQDLADARSVVARQGKRLDRERLLSIAGELGVRDDVRDLLTEVDELLEEELD